MFGVVESSFCSKAWTPARQSDFAESCAFAWIESAVTRQDAATSFQKKRVMESGKDYLQRVVLRVAEFTSRLAAALRLGYLHLRGELLQDSCQIRLRLQNRANRVNGNSLHPLDRVSDRKC